MAADIQDWTQAVAITGTATVTISGTAVVSISGTPSVTISGTPTVILGGGTASIGSISAIGSTVTVAGTINIGNTPAVTISGTPSVTIASGTVTISGTPSINIQSQSVTLSTQQGQQAMADLVFPAGASTQVTAAIPAGTQALMLINGDIASLNTMSVVGHVSQTNYLPIDKAQFGVVLGSKDIMVIPIASVLDTTYDVIATNPTGAAITVRLIALFGVQAVWVQSTSKQPVFGWDVVKPYDFQAAHVPAVAAQATITAAASLQGRWMASMVHASLVAGGTAGKPVVQVVDGAAQKWAENASVVAAANSVDHVELENGAVVGTFNTAMVVNFSAGFAGAQEIISCGLHLVGTR